MPPTLHRFSVSLILILFVVPISAQPVLTDRAERDSLYMYVQRKVGLDQVLYHGTQFFERYARFKGSPYYPDDHFYNGGVTLCGTTYQDLSLKYDCFTQKLILEYTDLQKRYNQIYLDLGKMDSFRLGSFVFHKCMLPGEAPGFYQVSKTGQVTGYIHWRKESRTISFDNRYTHEFSDPKAVCWMRIHGKVFPITSRKSFISIFPGHLQSEAKEFLRIHRIHVKQPDYTALSEMTRFVADRIEKIVAE